MKNKICICIAMVLVMGCMSTSQNQGIAAQDEPVLAVTPAVKAYASTIVLPRLYDKRDQDRLAQLLLVSNTLIDGQVGVSINKMEPSKFMVYDMLCKVKLGVVSTVGLSSVQKQTLRRWHEKYMQDNPANVFFAPSAGEIISTRAAFGCSHYARAFMAVVKALKLVSTPEDIRYVVSSKADDYNSALEHHDTSATINGHQFVIVRIDARWTAINTSKGKSTLLPEDFDPDACGPPHNVPVSFESYPGVVFLIRRVGANWDDDCGDKSLSALMNISRSGSPDHSEFLWERF